MSLHTIAQPRAPRTAFGQIVRNEARLAWRQPAGMIVGIGVSLLLLVIFGSVSVFQQPSEQLGGLSAFDIRWSPTGSRACCADCRPPRCPDPGYWPRSSSFRPA